MKPDKIEAIYEHGGFRPIDPVEMNLVEGQKVRLLVEAIERPDDVLTLATQVYEGLSDETITTIEVHLRRREDFFSERSSI